LGALGDEYEGDRVGLCLEKLTCAGIHSHRDPRNAKDPNLGKIKTGQGGKAWKTKKICPRKTWEARGRSLVAAWGEGGAIGRRPLAVLGWGNTRLGGRGGTARASGSDEMMGNEKKEEEQATGGRNRPGSGTKLKSAGTQQPTGENFLGG